jgi:uncharacterized protein YbaR (Trm112 family)
MENLTCPTCKQPLRSVEAEQEIWLKPNGHGSFMEPVESGIWERFCGGCFGDLPQELFEAFFRFAIENPPKTLTVGPEDPDPFSRLTLLSPVEGEDRESFEKRQARAWKRGPLTLRF